MDYDEFGNAIYDPRAGTGIVASSRTSHHDGDIAGSLLYEKNESTSIREDPDLVNNHSRLALADRSPEEPLYEDEAPRYDNHSQMYINLRQGGSRYDSDPWHPELMLGDLSPDPRGMSYIPDFRKLADQQRFRAERYRNPVPECHDHVPERERNGYHVQMDKRRSFWLNKDRMKWFSTSKDGRHNGSKFFRLNDRSQVVDTTRGVEAIDLNDVSSQRNRGNVTHWISNNFLVGSRQLTDHVWKVGQYGAHPKQGLAKSHADLNALRNKTERTTPKLVEFRGNLVPKSVAYIHRRQMAHRTHRSSNPANWSLEQKVLVRHNTRLLDPRKLPQAVDHKMGRSNTAKVRRSKLRGGRSLEHAVGSQRKVDQRVAAVRRTQAAKSASRQTPRTTSRWSNSMQIRNYSAAPPKGNVRANNTRMSTTLASSRVRRNTRHTLADRAPNAGDYAIADRPDELGPVRRNRSVAYSNRGNIARMVDNEQDRDEEASAYL